MRLFRTTTMMRSPIIVAVIVTILVLGVGALITNVGQWYQDLRKPSWNPPNWVFGPAWTVILGLAAWAGVIAWDNSITETAHVEIAILFAINIILHMLWTPLFFNLRRPDWALIEIPFLWISIALLIFKLGSISSLAGALLIPYLLWVSFAAYLNLTIVRINPRFGEN